jgi:tetratricopeptide (TPR) repeat protein
VSKTRLIVAWLLAACARCDDAEPVALAKLHAELHGCSAQPDDETCEVDDDDAVVIWVPGEAPVEIEGATAAQRAHEGGRLLQLSRELTFWEPADRPSDPTSRERRRQATEPSQLREVLLVLRRSDALSSLRLRRYEVPEGITRAREARARGDLDAADAALAEVRPRDDRERGLLLGMRARVAFSRGDANACVDLYDQSIPLLEGRDSERRADALARAFVLFRRLGRSGEARRALDTLRAELGESTVHRSSTSMQLGTLLHSQGRFREAIDTLTDAERHAARVEDLVVLAGAVEIRADALHRLGRHDEGRAAMATLEPWQARMDPCTRATYVTNLGNQGTLEETEASLRGSLAPLEEGWSLFRHECPRPVDAATAAVNLSTTHLRLGQLEEARRWLDRALELEVRDHTVNAWSIELQAEVALRDGDFASAEASFTELGRRARASDWLDLVWRAEHGLGRVLEAAGRTDDALRAWARAEDTVDEWHRRIPLEGAGRFFASTDARSARRRVQLALAVGLPKVAFETARHARRRGLAAVLRPASVPREGEEALEAYWRLRDELAERAARAWSVPSAELDAFRRTLDEGRSEAQGRLEALYASFPALRDALGAPPSPSEGTLEVVLFPLDDATLAVLARGPAPSTDVLAAQVPFDVAAVHAAIAPRLVGTTQVRVLAEARARRLSLHAAVGPDGPLGATHDVVYGLDLGTTPRVGSARRVLVVADPSRNLEGARREAERTAAAWRARGAEVRVLEGRAATHRAWLDAMVDTDVLHYAGHGEAGGGLWNTGLPLADDRLTLSDVLASPAVPREVWLLGCETAHVDATGTELALPAAFVAAGAEHVVATTEPLDDAAALELLDPTLVGRSVEERLRAAYRRDASAVILRHFVP